MVKIIFAFFICTLFFLSQPLMAQQINAELLQKPWKAQWITGPGVPINRGNATSDLSLKDYGVFKFRKTVELKDKPAAFIVHVSADNRYKLFVNGKQVSQGPARGDLYFWNFETIDIAPHLESGGGAKTSCLYAMPEAAPYFNKASVESGPGVRMTPRETAAMLLKELNISPKDWRKLLEVPAADLLRTQARLPFVAPFLEKNAKKEALQRKTGGFGPVVDGIVLPHHPFDPSAPEISRNKPLLVGWNEDEYTFFAWERKDTDTFKLDFEGLQKKLEPQYGPDTEKIIAAYRTTRPNASAPDIYVAIASITMMGLGSVDIAEKKAKQQGAPVYLYNFGYKSEKKIPGTDYPMGTPHAMDISFKFNNEVPPRDGSAPKESFFGGNRPERFVASHNFAELWTTFARTGKPAAKNAPQWPAYNLTDRPTMRIDAKCELINNRFSEELDMWRSIGKL